MDEPTARTAVSVETAKQPDHPLDASIIEFLTRGNIGDRLRAAGVPLTLQRLVVAQVMLAEPVHLTADQVLARVRGILPEISRATVYNTLKLFGEKRLVREIIADAERVVFDSNTSPHYHMYDAATGEVRDVAAGEIKVVGAATLPPGLEVEDIDVVIRVRRKGALNKDDTSH